jgi:superfamily II DNA or RNA helicase
MVRVNFCRSWIYITPLDKEEIKLPYKAKPRKDGTYAIPNTPYNFVFVADKNDIHNYDATVKKWKEEFEKQDNMDRRALMERIKLGEKEQVPKIKEVLRNKGIHLWDMLFDHQVVTTYLSLIYNSYGLFLEMGGGKAQPLDSKVLTTDGWKSMGDIKVGDKVINPEGGIATVTGVFPQGKVPTYEIKTKDGGRTKASGEHLWKTKVAIRPTLGGIKTTKEIKQFVDRYTQQKPGYKQTILLPVCSEIDTNPTGNTLPVEPYLLGVIIGDGCCNQKHVKVSLGDKDIVEHINDSLGKVKFHGGCYNANVIRINDKLEPLGLRGKKSQEKFIPEIYLTGSIEQRKELLRGLLDTDGTVDNRGHISYSTSSKQLAKDVLYLVRSLGGTAQITTKKRTFYTNKSGERVYCKPAYILNIAHNNPPSLFKVKRKKEKCQVTYCAHRAQTLSRKVTEVNYIGEEECQCISLDSENGLYITDDFIVTHNTISSLQVAATRLAKGQVDYVLVVCPASIMRAVWKAEIDNIRSRYKDANLTYEVLDGTKDERIHRLKTSKSKIYILNYEMLAKLLPNLINKGFGMLIFDESTRIKNPASQVTKAAHELAKRSRYNLILTGTPIPNKEMDIHAQMNVLQVNSYFHPLTINFFSFRNRYFFRPTAYRFAPFILKKDKKDELNRRIYSLAVSYKRDECVQLPPLTIQTIPCHMTPEQTLSYNELKENVLTEIRGRAVSAPIAITKLLRLAQITAGFSMDVNGNPVRFDTKPKINTVVELIDSIQDKVVVFCRFRETIKILKEELGDIAVTFYGDDSKHQKDKALESFKKSKKVLIAQLQSGGVGLNLQHASYCIFCELDFSPANYLQAIARIYRTGQKKKCTVYVTMCAGTIDEHLFDVINKKKISADKLLKTVVSKLENESAVPDLSAVKGR